MLFSAVNGEDSIAQGIIWLTQCFFTIIGGILIAQNNPKGKTLR
jgi:hypothetical protein